MTIDVDISKFKNWLTAQGCEILPVTNEYERFRFKGRSVGVIYKSGKFGSEYAKGAYMSYKKGEAWSGSPVKTGRYNTYRKQKIQILDRDGDTCFLCGCKLGNDITLEHLQPLSKGGRNTLSNMVLMHEQCNKSLSNYGLVQKINLIIEKRKPND